LVGIGSKVKKILEDSQNSIPSPSPRFTFSENSNTGGKVAGLEV